VTRDQSPLLFGLLDMSLSALRLALRARSTPGTSVPRIRSACIRLHSTATSKEGGLAELKVNSRASSPVTEYHHRFSGFDLLHLQAERLQVVQTDKPKPKPDSKGLVFGHTFVRWVYIPSFSVLPLC
jgi:hypothetical protein